MKNYKIIFNDGKSEFVTLEGYTKIIEQSANLNIKTFQIGRNLYRFSDIKRMQEPKGQNLNQIDRLLKGLSKEKRLRAVKNMIVGLKKYMASPKYGGSEVTKNLLKTMESRNN